MESESFLRFFGFVVLWISMCPVAVYRRRYQREQAAQEFVSNVRREMEANPIILNMIPVVNTRESDPSLPTYDQIMRGKILVRHYYLCKAEAIFNDG